MSSQDVNTDQRRAYTALQELLHLGLKQKDVALELDICQTIICHINGIYLHPHYHVSPRIADALEELVRETRQSKSRAMLEGWPLVVLETCNSEGAIVDDSVRASIREAILAGLSAGSRPTPTFQFALPPDIAGALASLGPDAWVFVRRSSTGGNDPRPSGDEAAPGGDGSLAGGGGSGPRGGGSPAREQIKVLKAEIQKARVKIHEMNHLINILEADASDEQSSYVPKAAY